MVVLSRKGRTTLSTTSWHEVFLSAYVAFNYKIAFSLRRVSSNTYIEPFGRSKDPATTNSLKMSPGDLSAKKSLKPESVVYAEPRQAWKGKQRDIASTWAANT